MQRPVAPPCVFASAMMSTSRAPILVFLSWAFLLAISPAVECFTLVENPAHSIRPYRHDGARTIFRGPLLSSTTLFFPDQRNARGGSSSLAPLHAKDKSSDDKVAVGTEEYYKGFVTRSLDEEPADRVSGDALLGPTFKFVGGAAAILGALFLGFLVSNGIL